MQGPTLLAPDDPYDAIGSTFKPKTVAKAGNQTSPALDPDKPVMRAIPVVPASRWHVEVRRAVPVRPIDESQPSRSCKTNRRAPLDFSDDH